MGWGTQQKVRLFSAITVNSEKSRPIKTGLFASHHPTRPAGRMTGCSRVGSGSVHNLSGRVGSSQEVLKYRGSGQVGSRLLQISRAGSGSSNLTGWVGSGRVGSRSVLVSRVESGRVKKR